MAGVIPTLSLNNTQLTEPRDQVAYIIRHAFYNPGWTSSQIEDTLVSIRSFMAKYTEDRDRLLPALQGVLQQAISAYLPGYTVNVSARNIGDNNTYTLAIRVTTPTNELVLTQEDIVIENGVLVIGSDKEK